MNHERKTSLFKDFEKKNEERKSTLFKDLNKLESQRDDVDFEIEEKKDLYRKELIQQSVLEIREMMNDGEEITDRDLGIILRGLAISIKQLYSK